MFEQDYFETSRSNYGEVGGYWTTPQPWHEERVNRILELSPTSVLDVGAANGLIVTMLRSHGIEAIGVDISRYMLDNALTPYLVHGSAVSLPFGTGQFDLVTSADLLEHIPEDDVRLAIVELRRVGHRNMHDICTVDTGHDDTHVTMKPLEWWLSRFPGAMLKTTN